MRFLRRRAKSWFGRRVRDASSTNNLVFGARVVDNPSGTIVRSLGVGGNVDRSSPAEGTDVPLLRMRITHPRCPTAPSGKRALRRTTQIPDATDDVAPFG
jgi:hypothetical protein